MQGSRDRILTTHTGSLHRPPDLEEMFRKKLAGESFLNPFSGQVDRRIIYPCKMKSRSQIDLIFRH